MSAEAVAAILSTTRAMEQFWRKVHGWAPRDAAALLAAARFDRQLSLEITLTDSLSPSHQQ